MEVSGLAIQWVPCLSGAGTGTHPSKPSISGVSVGATRARELRVLGFQDSAALMRPRKAYGAMIMDSGFCEKGHLQYYYVGPRCAEKKEKEKEKDKCSALVSALTSKKKLKLFKGLAEDLSKFSDMGFGLDSENGLADGLQQKVLSDAAEILMKQLQHLRQEEKELKKRRKEEDAKLKGTQMNTMLNCESSSSSESESSDGECEDMVDKSRLRREPLAQPTQSELGESVLISQENGKLTLPNRLTQEVNTTMAVGSENLRLENEVECCAETSISCSSSSVSRSDRSSSMTGGSAKRIEVCMGKKCEKSGAAALLEEFVRVVGVEGAVVGCKCLGKCRDGPNVRISNCGDDPQVEGVDVSVRTPTNPLCIGVGLDEVGVIVANFFGDEQKDLGLPAAV